MRHVHGLCGILRLAKLLLKTDNGLVHGQNTLHRVLILEAAEEAIDCAVVQRRSKSVKHGGQLDFVNCATIIRIVLAKHCPPELLSYSLV